MPITSTQTRVLWAMTHLWHETGRCPLREVAALTGYDLGTAASAAQRLYDQGMVTQYGAGFYRPSFALIAEGTR